MSRMLVTDGAWMVVRETPISEAIVAAMVCLPLSGGPTRSVCGNRDRECRLFATVFVRSEAIEGASVRCSKLGGWSSTGEGRERESGVMSAMGPPEDAACRGEARTCSTTGLAVKRDLVGGSS